MTSEYKKAVALSEKILIDIDGYFNTYVSNDGKHIKSQDSLKKLNSLLESGFILYNYVVQYKLYNTNTAIKSYTVNLEKIMNKLTINVKNAKKLTLSNAIQIWQQALLTIAVLANSLIEFDNDKVI